MHGESEKAKSVVNIPPVSAHSFPQQQILLQFLEDHRAPLLSTIRFYARCLSLDAEDGEHIAIEVLQETVIEALNHAGRFDPTRQPRPWLLGIALNIIKRKKADMARRQQREVTLGQLSRLHPEYVTESDLLDHLIPPSEIGPEQEVEADEQVRALLSLVSVEDQEVLCLAILEGFEREALAQRLGTTVGTAGMRLHRALRRLRAAWDEQQRGEQHE